MILYLYKKFISPDTGMFSFLYKTSSPTCVFYPTCSEYSSEVIKKYGIIKGLYKTFIRIVRCHPFQKEHIDLP